MKVKQTDVDELLNNAEYSEYVFYDKCLIVACKLPNNYVIFGKGACVDPKEFDLEVGREVAMEQIIHELWGLLGYQLQDEVHKNNQT